jgi:hypothetical protein
MKISKDARLISCLILMNLIIRTHYYYYYITIHKKIEIIEIEIILYSQ